jgi:hypothetical protein
MGQNAGNLPCSTRTSNRVLLKTCQLVSAFSGFALVRGGSLPFGGVRAVIFATVQPAAFLKKPVL